MRDGVVMSVIPWGGKVERVKAQNSECAARRQMGARVQGEGFSGAEGGGEAGGVGEAAGGGGMCDFDGGGGLCAGHREAVDGMAGHVNGDGGIWWD